MVELFKKLLFIVYKGKEKNYYYLILEDKLTKELGKIEAYRTKKSW